MEQVGDLTGQPVIQPCQLVTESKADLPTKLMKNTVFRVGRADVRNGEVRFLNTTVSSFITIERCVGWFKKTEKLSFSSCFFVGYRGHDTKEPKIEMYMAKSEHSDVDDKLVAALLNFSENSKKVDVSNEKKANA